MTLITKRRLVSLVSASAMVATLALAAAPAATLAAKPSGTTSSPPPTYHNGFEKATDVMTVPEDGPWPAGPHMFNVTRVASKATAIKAASGGWYATAGVDAYAFTRYGGYSNTFPTNGYRTSVAIYLDMDKADGVADLNSAYSQFDWSSAVYSNAAGFNGFGRDFIFSVGEKPSVPGSFIMSASNNAPGNPANPERDPLTVSTSGWYTFQHNFRNDGGVLAVDMSVIFQGQVLDTWTLSDPSDLIGPTGIGGNRYGWLVDNDFDGLALDNVTRVKN